jgi:hypothetical protein
MRNADYDAVKKQFDDFSQRLDARIREFRHDGMFATTHAAYAARLLKGQACVEAKLEEAAHRGEVWAATKAEVRRDLNALIGDFGHLEETLDAQVMKH